MVKEKLKEREKFGFSKVPYFELPNIPINTICNLNNPFKLSNVPYHNIFPYNNTALGGTFDHPHIGHKILLSLASLLPKTKLYIGLTHESLLSKKTYNEA